jgi:hypothetical protein
LFSTFVLADLICETLAAAARLQQLLLIRSS